jgi:glycine C-acetyltransferase
VYVIGFSYPVVPMGKARIRTQMSAALSPSDITTAISAFAEVATELGLTHANT